MALTPRSLYGALVVLVTLALLLVALPPAKGQGTEEYVWVREFGTSDYDSANAVAVDSSGVYVAGRVLGAFVADAYDAFLRKYDTGGGVLWVRQIGTESFDYGNAVATDGSGVYVAGHTGGNLEYGAPGGGVDAYIRKYDVNGNVLWTRQFGSTDFDTALALAVDETGAYVAGRTEGTIIGETSLGNVDAFLRKYDPAGYLSWSHQFGTYGYDVAAGVTVDASGVYVAGETTGTFPGEARIGSGDAFLRKYDGSGNVLWTRQFGTNASAWASAITADASNIYVAGTTVGAFPGETNAGSPGTSDVFLRKYDASGGVAWTRQFGSPGGDAGFGVAANPLGVYVVGQTDGIFPGGGGARGPDAFLRKYDASGALLGTRQFGSSGFDKANAAAVGGSGVYVAGETNGAFPGETNAGGVDAFLAAPVEPPPPAAEPRPSGEALVLVLGLSAGGGILFAAVVAAVYVSRRRKQDTSQPPPVERPPVP